MRRHLALTALLLTALVGGARPARGADLRDLLRRSTFAEQRISFQGTKMLTGRVGEAESRGMAKVYHRAPDQTLMVGVDGDLDGNRVLQLGREHFQKRRGDFFRQVNHLPAADSTELMLQNYTLREMRTEQIARRKCVMVSIEPRHRGNPRKLVWLDVKTALPLKTQIWSPDGKLCEESYFLTIQYGPRLSRTVFRLPANTVRNPWPSTNPDFDIVSVPERRLPPGYRLVETTTRQIPGRGIVSIQRFSDGLNTLSLLQSSRISARNLADLGGSAAVSGKVGSVHFALCGEQQPEALRRLTQSIQASR
jgi:negative regulator of sigma E activity